MDLLGLKGGEESQADQGDAIVLFDIKLMKINNTKFTQRMIKEK
jgi:hypothetical protein